MIDVKAINTAAGDLPKSGITPWEADGTTDQTISWHVYGPVTNIKISYANGGAYIGAVPPVVLSTLADSGAGGDNKGSYLWKVPTDFTNDLIPKIDSGDMVKLMVEDASAYGTWCNVETQNFVVKGILTLTEPDVSSGLVAGTTYTVKWERKGTINSANVKYSTDSGTSYPNDIEAGATWAIPTDVEDTASWAIPETATLGTTYKILVEDNDYEKNGTNGTYAESVTFRVKGEIDVTSPTSPTTWAIADTKTISWNILHGDMTNVKLYYSTTGVFGGEEVEIDPAVTKPSDNVLGFPNGAPPPMAQGSYDWTIPISVPIGDIWIRVSDSNTTDFADVYDDTAKITIKGSVILEEPGIDWKVGGTTEVIQWTANGNLGKVWIEFSDGGPFIKVTDPAGVGVDSGNGMTVIADM